jgi:Tfp pilus assembly protein PilO
MMGARHVDRIWIFAGAVVIVLLSIVSWFLLISPKYADAADIRGQTETSRIQLVTLQHKIANLQQQSSQLPTFRAALKKSQQALPSDSGMPDFLRQLQTSGSRAKVRVSNITVATPQLVKDSTSLYEVPISLTADGSTSQLGAFLVQLQNVQSRAVLVESANLTSAGPAAELNLTLNAFVAAAAGAGAPTITTN